MPNKAIVLCSDGTWNGPEDSDGQSVLESEDVADELSSTAITNVVKLYANLAGASIAEAVALRNEDEKVLTDSKGVRLQVCKYLHGVGDSTNPLFSFMGGVFGIGVVARIVRGYTFISRHYEPGDDIHICGFSRGAYTARALAEMICNVGLLDPRRYDPNSKMQAYRLGIAAWAKSKTLQLAGMGALEAIGTDVIGKIEEFLAAPLTAGMLRDIPTIRSVAVWDTVGAMGIPAYVKGSRADVFRLVDTVLDPKIANGFHAMSVDELRVDFPVTKWDARTGQRQTWFVGAHADVGGGYAASESSLSDLTLDWMTRNLRGEGIFCQTPLSYTPTFAHAGTQPVHTPWTNPPFDHLGRSQRDVVRGEDIHASVTNRWKADPNYRPAALRGLVT